MGANFPVGMDLQLSLGELRIVVCRSMFKSNPWPHLEMECKASQNNGDSGQSIKKRSGGDESADLESGFGFNSRESVKRGVIGEGFALGVHGRILHREKRIHHSKNKKLYTYDRGRMAFQNLKKKEGEMVTDYVLAGPKCRKGKLGGWQCIGRSE